MTRHSVERHPGTLTPIPGMAILVLAVLTLAAAPAGAGSMPLAWDPVDDEDLQGYRVYYGTAPGSYSDSVDVGNATSHTLTGLTDCTRYYVAVKAVKR